MSTRSDHNRCVPGEVLFILIYLFLISPHLVIVPRLKSQIATYNSNYFACIRHFFKSLLSVLAIVFVTLIKTLSHFIPLVRDAVGLKLLFKIISTFVSCFSNLHPKFVYLVKLLL